MPLEPPPYYPPADCRAPPRGSPIIPGRARGEGMPQNLYIATIEPGSGKSLVALSVMVLLSSRVQRLGFFRPVIREGDAVRALKLADGMLMAASPT